MGVDRPCNNTFSQLGNPLGSLTHWSLLSMGIAHEYRHGLVGC